MRSFIPQPDGKVFHIPTQLLLDEYDLPATMRFESSVGNYQLVRNKSDFPTINGTKFVLIDYCTDFFSSKSGKTRYAKFENFEYISSGSYKVGNDWLPFKYNFEIGCGYIFFLEVNPLYFSNLEIKNYKKLGNGTLEKNI